MPLNKLENFIKNAEGRILYVNPNDLDSTDGIENQGNSLTKPFKTIQRALIESARFSYLRGDDNDLVEKTTILVFPGEHLIDNRPGYAIKDAGGNAIAVAPGGAETAAQAELTLTLNSNFDLTQEDNILYKFNSINGGIIIPRGTSIVGLDLRKTKVRPKYVPNPTDPNAPNSAIFRVTGACYFWQFTFFDGDETGLVYTDPRDFSSNNRSKPTFSHHKLTCFEYADGVNIPGGYQLTDLDMYYSKISNAFNRASGREIDQKFPASPESFAKQRPEWEIVGAFATDPITISSIISGDGATPGTVVTVTTQTPHNLNAGTPIKIKGINVEDYNISTKVTQVLSETRFTYALPFVRSNLPAGPGAGLAPSNGASVVIETDTVTGASPYIFNVSLRSVYGMAGMHADGSKADGFRSMVVAQFTAVSLQKDDRAFVKYYPSNRRYSGISYTKVTGERLSSESSSTNEETVFHLDSDAVYRDGWKTTHIKMSNDSVIQIVSVFAIGFHKHFECLSGGDASITNSNSNFGQFSLSADGFKADSFDKDDKGYVTGVVTPKSTDSSEVDIEWVQFDIEKTNSVNDPNRLYLLGYTQIDIQPPIISQGYRIGAKEGDTVYIEDGNNEYNAKILMTNVIPESTSSNTVSGTDTSAKVYNGVQITTPLTDTTGTQTVYNTANNHNLRNGESIRVFSETGDLPEGLEENKVYYAVTSSKNSTRTDGISLSASQFQIASSKTNATAATPIFITSYQGEQLRVESRVSDKIAGEIGHPIQYDYVQGNWFVYVESGSTLYSYFQTLTTSIASSQFTISPSDGQTHTVSSTSYPVMGKLYVPTSVSSSSIDVVVVFHGTVSPEGPNGPSIADASVTALNHFLDPSGLNVRDKIIFSAAYPQDHISQARNLNISGTGTEQADFLMGDNLPYARAAVGWVKNSLNSYMSSNGISKTIGNVYLFGHSQGGKLVAKMNTLETGIAGVIANAPGPIQFDQTCASGGSSTISCTKIAAIHGASTGNGDEPYQSIGLETYTSTHNAPILFTQATGDQTGGGNQYTWLQDYVNALEAISANAEATLTTVSGSNHAAFTSDSTLQSAIRTFVGSSLGSEVDESEISFVRRVEDGRSIDEKIYKLRYVIPKELNNSRDPVSGFILQDSSSVNVRENSDFNLTEITTSDYDFDRNPRFISSCTYSNPTNTITITADRTHNLKVNDTVIIENVTSSSNQSGRENFGYNGSFLVSNIVDDKTFDVSDVDIFGITHTPGSGSFDSNVRDKTLPTFRRSDSQENIYIYRVEVVKPYIKDVQDGVYYLYILNSNNGVAQADGEFASFKYSQNITDLYPQLDRDNSDDNPPAAVSFAKRTPLGEVVTNDLKRSITRETVDKFFKTYSYGNEVISVSNSNTSATLTFDFEHQLAGITSFTTLNGGSGHTDGSYYNVKLFNNASAPSSAVWDGATADITVSGGAVTAVKIVENGSGYTNGEALYFNSDQIGGTPQANIQISTADISVATNDYVQVTGIGTTGGGYYKITNTNNKKEIGIAKTAGDPVVSVGEYVTVLGRVGQFTYSSGSLGSDGEGTFVFTTTSPTGLVAGNSVRLLDASNNNLGDYLITSTNKGSTHIVSIFARKDISTATQFLKHGLSANNASADNLGENIGTRTLSFYDNNTLVTNQSINVSTTQFKVTLPGGSTTAEKIESRFPVGSYIQIDNEIMRVSFSSLTGTNTDEIQVIRGSMGTIIESHETNSLVKKIKLSPIEFRRPSILRASGHTFEYLGYGPGNYSTGLPQVQLKTLTEDEEFLSQSQETACGTVLYTGMDSDGDFYIGNTKYSAQSGEQKTFDVPTPTITGEDPNRLSVVFDEIIVKERILVEGGKSKQILSQFDGPVTFTNNVRFNKTLILNGVPQSLRTAGTVDIRSDADASSCSDQNAALRVLGGVAIGKKLWVCGDTDLGGTLSVDGTATFGDSSASTQLVGGIQPIVDAHPGNGYGVPLGSIDKAFAEAHIGRIMIGHFDANNMANTGNQFITTRSGTLKLSGEKGAREVEVFSNMIVWDETAAQTRYDGSFVTRGGVGIVKNAIIGEELRVGGDCFLGGSVSLRGNTSVAGTLSVTDNTTLGGALSVTNGATIGGNLTVNGNGNFGSNTVSAGRFAGTADQSNAVLVGRAMDAGGDDHPMLVVADPSPDGTYSKIFRDNNIRFRESSATLIVDGDIIAFASDDRLKTNKVGISNALDKVNSLSGFTYNWNEFACEQGNAFHADKKQVGVSAQEVQKVLPEAVEPAPFNEDYLTVKYDKIVPLLIEAIKELSDKVSALEDKLNN